MTVIPAKAGTSGGPAETSHPGVPAFAGMTGAPYSRASAFSAIARAIALFWSAERSGFPPLMRERIVGGETAR